MSLPARKSLVYPLTGAVAAYDCWNAFEFAKAKVQEHKKRKKEDEFTLLKNAQSIVFDGHGPSTLTFQDFASKFSGFVHRYIKASDENAFYEGVTNLACKMLQKEEQLKEEFFVTYHGETAYHTYISNVINEFHQLTDASPRDPATRYLRADEKVFEGYENVQDFLKKDVYSYEPEIIHPHPDFYGPLEVPFMDPHLDSRWSYGKKALAVNFSFFNESFRLQPKFLGTFVWNDAL